jgi:two-component system cell cycle sensor histidine kinase/response regulator CckA
MIEKSKYEKPEKRIQKSDKSDLKGEKNIAVLLERLDRYRTIVDHLSLLICNYLPGGEISFVNDAYCNYFEQSFDELVGSNFLSLIPVTDQKTVLDNISALTPDSPTQSHEHAVISPNGDIRWQRWINRAIFDGRERWLNTKLLVKTSASVSYLRPT